MIDELKERIEKKLVTIGTESTLKNLREGNLEKVFITKNCPEDVREDIKDFSEEVEIVELDKTNEELGVMCKKQYAISVLGFLKEK
ncbi:ribosomal L7Ae/L30e/S12e/Gadd45 family protein [Candidatus Woesearchaeota archaeon]|nr:ribosomal L7Ae/L30e/S12e/Gadd45 family protein [Candidatus Woesearchaeota archaeon]MBW3013941.1 ribosomal L7Ae/L30e/S12e/Gadd45 family protein [Candidatus Woesearchaeota archaeon]